MDENEQVTDLTAEVREESTLPAGGTTVFRKKVSQTLDALEQKTDDVHKGVESTREAIQDGFSNLKYALVAFVVFNVISKFITFSGGQTFDENKMNSIIMFVSGFILDFVPIIIVVLATGMTVPEKLSKIQSLSESVLRRRAGKKMPKIQTKVE